MTLALSINSRLVNPFFHHGPVRDVTYFFGRMLEIRRAMGLLQNQQSISIVGPRRIGKSSFINILGQTLRSQQRQMDISMTREIVTAHVDCEKLSRASASELFAALAQAFILAQNAKTDNTDIPDAPSLVEFRDFEKLIRNAIRDGQQPIFLLDEFDTLSKNPGLDADVFSGLRSLSMEYGLVYVTASTRPLLELTYAQASTLSSPFFNFFAQIRLGLFTQDEAFAMLKTLSQRGGLSFSQDDCETLIAQAGTHPLLLQMAAYLAFDSLSQSEQIGKVDWISQHKKYYSDARRHLEHAWIGLSEEDRRVLALLPASARGNAESLRWLDEACLIRVDGEGNTVGFSEAFRKFVALQVVEGMYQAPPITLDMRQHIVLLRDKLLELTTQEFCLLKCLIAEPGRVFTKQALEASLSEADDEPAGDNRFTHISERLRVALRTLRRALGDDADCIQNKRGDGYCFIRKED